MVKKKDIIDALLGLPKSIYFCFKYLPLGLAIRLPVLLSHHVCLANMKGTVHITASKITVGLIKIGFGEVGIFDRKYSRTIWQNNGGGVTFKGKCSIGHGSRISINKMGELIFGENFGISAESHIVCSKKIQFGNDVLISWQCLIMDTDFHKVFSKSEQNVDQSVCIGNHVWIGCRSTILKGTNIADNCVIAANSNVVRGTYDNHTIIAGNPAIIVKRDIEWEM